MIVVDTSAILRALVGRPPNPELSSRLGEEELHAPHLIDAELVHALRRLVLAADLTEDRASDARSDFAELAMVRYPHQPLSDRMWELRHNLSAYDAAFVALSEALEAPLVTCDRRLASAPGHGASIELFDRS
ncbi:MAG TPA: type II toxin-antitoxin system VapC family toxin [Actinomycetota bacterium]|nr:type II toxin-antitoxin system VapC family toxin [Actinomycetota bacterium]